MNEKTLPLLVGEAPSKTGDRYWQFPLSGAAARTLCDLAAIPPVEGGTKYGQWTWALYERFDCVNVFERYHEATPWDGEKARQRALEILDTEEADTIVMLGRKVTKAFTQVLDLPMLEFHEWVGVVGARRDLRVASIPHPSGLNRLLNYPDKRELCRQTLQQAQVVIEQGAISAPFPRQYHFDEVELMDPQTFAEAEFERVSGGLICECGERADDHPHVWDEGGFRKLCDGRLIKT